MIELEAVFNLTKELSGATDMTCESTYEVISGDDVKLRVAVFDKCNSSDAVPVDISGADAIEYTIFKERGCDQVLQKTVGDGIAIDAFDEITNPDDNHYTITLDTADTATLCGVYYHNSKVTLSGDIMTVFESENVEFN